MPLDIRGTAFQWEVWRHLRSIPTGTTRTYHEVASAIGRPAAIRAVARACASNQVALLIPCHRVVRSDGSLGGHDVCVVNPTAWWNRPSSSICSA